MKTQPIKSVAELERDLAIAKAQAALDTAKSVFGAAFDAAELAFDMSESPDGTVLYPGDCGNAIIKRNGVWQPIPIEEALALEAA